MFTSDLAARATALLDAGLSGAAVARTLGVSVPPINKWRREGLIGTPATTGTSAADPAPAAAAPEDDTAPSGAPDPLEAGTDRTARDHRDRQAPMGRATCDVQGRVLVSIGQAGPPEVQFNVARGVRRTGVLAALPALLKDGLLAVSGHLSPLPKAITAWPRSCSSWP